MGAQKTVKLQLLPLPSLPMMYKNKQLTTSSLTWLLCQSGIGMTDEHGWGVVHQILSRLLSITAPSVSNTIPSFSWLSLLLHSLSYILTCNRPDPALRPPAGAALLSHPERAKINNTKRDERFQKSLAFFSRGSPTDFIILFLLSFMRTFLSRPRTVCQHILT